ncbi:RIC1-domain-containing protein [Dissophora ornata]|nr:RIC1-domain-containing protein [Dissophora ornata]
MYWATGSARVLAVEPSLLKVSSDGDDEELELVLPVVASGQDKSSDIDSNSQSGIQSRIVKGTGSGIVDMARNEQGSLWATITRESIQLWVHRPVGVISKVVRTPKSLLDHGANQRLLWKPDSTMLVVVTEQSFLHIYRIIPQGNDGASYQLTNSKSYALGPGEGIGFPDLTIKFKMTIKMDAGVSSLVGLDSDIVVATVNPPAVQLIPWMGKVDVKTCLIRHMNFLLDKSVKIVSMSRFPKSTTQTWCMSDGKAYIVYYTPNASDTSSPNSVASNGDSWYGFCFHGNPEGFDKQDAGVVAASNPEYSLLAIGTRGGDVRIFKSGEHAGQWVFSHKLALKESQSYVNNTPDKIVSLAWNSDGSALAVGQESRCPSIWSVFGRRLFPSASHDIPSLKNASEDPYLQGTRALFWSAGNMDLIVLGADDSSSNFYAIPCAKSLSSVQNHLSSAPQCLLHLNDRLLVYSEGHRQDVTSTINPDTFVWNNVMVPAVYLSDNWPIRYSCLSQDGHYLAIAGRRGLAHYNLHSCRWRLFGNWQQEQSFRCQGGLAWFKNILIVGCETIEDQRYELRLYQRENNLDNNDVVFTEQFETRIAHISVWRSSLLVYTSNNTLYCYSLGSAKRVDLQLVWKTSLQDIVESPTLLKSVSILTAEGSDGNDATHITLLVDGKIYFLRPEFLTDGNVRLSFRQITDKVEYYWITRSAHDANDFSLWTFNGKTLKMWWNVFGPGGSERSLATFAKHNFLEMDIEFYPLAILPERGIVLGLEPEIATHKPKSLAMFKMATKTHLFLQTILRHVLTHNIDGEWEAYEFAKHYQDLGYFGHALEILLHNVLEDEADSGIGFEEGAVLPRVVSFLQQFPHYLDVIVSCARKTEVALWEYLFSIVGAPKDLFEQCLAADQLKTATSYLLILHTLEPLQTTSQDTVRLLEKTLQAQDFELCKELVRFLNSIDCKLDGEETKKCSRDAY